MVSWISWDSNAKKISKLQEKLWGCWLVKSHKAVFLGGKNWGGGCQHISFKALTKNA